MPQEQTMDSPVIEKAKRCTCTRCRMLIRTRHHIFGAFRPAGKGVTDDMTAMWNQIVSSPCEKEQRAG
jgi:hypothetical protein